MVYFFGDIHGKIDELLFNIKQVSAQPGDTVVLLGDVGLNYYDRDPRYQARKARLERTGLNFLCVHGNHECRPATLPYYHLTEWQGGAAYIEDPYPHLFFAKDGEVYDLEGHTAIVMGGAYSVDKEYRSAKQLALVPG